jgi:hypothetical protein
VAEFSLYAAVCLTRNVLLTAFSHPTGVSNYVKEGLTLPSMRLGFVMLGAMVLVTLHGSRLKNKVIRETIIILFSIFPSMLTY